MAVLEADGWVCQICGIPTPREKRGTQEPDAPTIDHIVPLSAGGAHSYANVQCACLRCNTRKGARTEREFGSIMGRRGPPPKSRAVKKAQGTYRKDRDTAAESAAAALPPGAPTMPTDLDEIARRRWIEIVPELLKAETLANIDGGAVEAYCRSFSRWSRLEAAAAEKPMIKTPFGLKANPAGAEARKVHKEIIQPLELALGLHYAARTRVKMPSKAKDADPVEEELFGPLKAIAGGKAEPEPA